MKRNAVIAVSLACISLLVFVALTGTKEPLNLGQESNQVTDSVPQSNTLISSGKPQQPKTDSEFIKDVNKPLKLVSSPPKLKAFRNKIKSAKTNKEFVQVILDIEFDASYEDLNMLIIEVYDVWASKDPLAALDYSKVLSSRYNDNGFIRYALEQAAIHDITDTQEWLNSNNLGSIEEKDQNVLAVYSGLAVNEPLEALQHLSEIEGSFYKQQLKLRALAEWAKLDPSQAASWLEADSSLTGKQDINDAYMAVISPMIESAPMQAESMILGMEASIQKDQMLSKYTKKLLVSDPNGAMQWAQNITDAKAYTVAVSTALDVLASSQNTQLEAFEHANKEPNPALRQEFLMRTLGNIAQQDPDTAAQQLLSLTFDEQKDMAITIAYSLSDSDSNDRLAWLDSLPSQELRDTVKKEFH